MTNTAPARTFSTTQSLLACTAQLVGLQACDTLTQGALTFAPSTDIDGFTIEIIEGAGLVSYNPDEFLNNQGMRSELLAKLSPLAASLGA